MEDPADAAKPKMINTKNAFLVFIIDLLAEGGVSASPNDIL